ncbi:TRAF-like [Arabidopsis thaliana x Arabidopsis arenosa]|uniref:TRAF-like n=1 Tax=Arabidopsis thaliana x Arabidopsis arenosa TaxID=1240361 RepID=A0A8T2AXF8_9BRAS|nr:TRAF-like [Arabidopsis thaliana x Arabidopsis arenosa]
MWKEDKSCVEANSTRRSKFEDRLPSTYSMKIQSLSQLNTLFPDDGYKSRSFSSGKYSWRLVIYPKGNKKDKGSGFLSMYVELDSKSLVASTVLAYLTFFVYNKKENNFFTIQDVEGKQFSALRPVWGFSQVIPLDTFNDPENGYVFEGDQCEFGVDVMVPHTNWEVVSFDQKPLYPKFSWTVNKFSKLKVNTYESKKFLMGGRNWVIMLYPKGKTNCKFLSLYLKADDKTIKEEVYAQVDMRILDPFGCNHVTRTSKS